MKESTRVLRRGLFLVASLALFSARLAGVSTTVVRNGDASIVHDQASAVWTIGAGGTTLTLRLGPGFDLQTLGLATASARQWIPAPDADAVVTINGTRAAVGRIADGFVYESAAGTAEGAGVRLDASFVLRDRGLRVTRHYAAVSGSPAFEVWTTLQSLNGAPAAAANLNALRLTVPSGTVRWVTGLQGDSADVEHDSAFSLQARSYGSIGSAGLSLGSSRRSSERMLPWVLVDGAPDEFFAALLWSGAWSLTAVPASSALTVDFSLPAMQTAVDASGLEGPHALFGVVRGGIGQATAAVRGYVAQGLRAGRPLAPLSTYNTWFAYGATIDQPSVEAEMDRVAALGVDLFVVDAGWYVGAGNSGPSDFDAGLGSWEVDDARFPGGLGALSDYAHNLGMKFGIWVEPERVHLDSVGEPGLAEEAWLAKAGQDTGSDHSALICLAGDEGRRWVQQKLFDFLDAVQPDYLKWDNNLWVNCDRSGHGHGATDGNFAQTRGLYQLLAAVRARYPDLIIENAASGGNRLDLEMLRYSDVAWMDDRTAPAVHVRHNIEGLSQLFPPAYLLSFLIEHPNEPLHNAHDVPMLLRSRMEGTLGLCFRTDWLTDDDLGAIGQEIQTYKRIQAAQADAASIMLTAQARGSGGPNWDVIQENAPDGTTLVFAFQNASSAARFVVKPSGLTSSTSYDVWSPDAGVVGTFKGSALAGTGIPLTATTTAAQMLVIRPQE